MLVNFSWIREGQVAGMGQPRSDGWALLEAEGVGAALVLTEGPPGGDPAGAGIVVEHVPLVDFSTPSSEDLERCVGWIDQQRAAGRAVVVQCLAGQGRTGTVLAAWLVSQGLGPEEAVAEVRRLRPGSIETAGQLRAVARFRTA